MKIRTVRTLYITLVFSTLCSCATLAERKQESIDVCYIPFDVDTYVPVTRSNFFHHCTKVAKVYQSDDAYRSILQFLDRHASTAEGFNEYGVRVGIVHNDEVIYVDQLGSIYDGGRVFKMDADALSDFKLMLDEMAAATVR